MPGPILASAGSDWSYGGSILTFVFPMILFLAVIAALYVLYTKPQEIPGHLVSHRSVVATPAVNLAAPPAAPAAGREDGGSPAEAGQPGQQASAEPAAAEPAAAEPAAGETTTTGEGSPATDGAEVSE